MDARTGLTAAVVLLGSLTLADPAAAGDATGLDWVAREPGAEIAVAAGALLAHTSGFIGQQSSGWGPAWKRAHHPAWATASDLTGSVLGASWQAAVAYALDVEYFGRRGVADGAEEAGRTSLVDLEAVVLATGISVAFKKLIGRCRPRAVHSFGCRELNGFPSGHTVLPSALAGSRLTLALRSDDAPERFAAFGIAESMSLATAAFRMLAGAHSWEDVLGGWVIGHATGAMISLAHPLRSVPAESPAETNAALTAMPSARAAPIGFVWSSRF